MGGVRFPNQSHLLLMFEFNVPPPPPPSIPRKRRMEPQSNQPCGDFINHLLLCHLTASGLPAPLCISRAEDANGRLQPEDTAPLPPFAGDPIDDSLPLASWLPGENDVRIESCSSTGALLCELIKKLTPLSSFELN
jgi:hypothetical protein